MFNVGDRVMLKEGIYTISRSNPLHTVGVVSRWFSMSSEYKYKVEWPEYETWNMYTDEDLIRVSPKEFILEI